MPPGVWKGSWKVLVWQQVYAERPQCAEVHDGPQVWMEWEGWGCGLAVDHFPGVLDLEFGSHPLQDTHTHK